MIICHPFVWNFKKLRSFFVKPNIMIIWTSSNLDSFLVNWKIYLLSAQLFRIVSNEIINNHIKKNQKLVNNNPISSFYWHSLFLLMLSLAKLRRQVNPFNDITWYHTHSDELTPAITRYQRYSKFKLWSSLISCSVVCGCKWAGWELCLLYRGNMFVVCACDFLSAVQMFPLTQPIQL